MSESIKFSWPWLIASFVGAFSLWAGAQWEVTLPVSPVSQSMQTLALVLLAAYLPVAFAALSVSWYLLAGYLGFPVFSNQGSGIEHFLGPTGGYLAGFLIAAAFGSWLFSRLEFPHLIRLFLIGLLMHLVVLGFGFAWLLRKYDAASAWGFGVQPFQDGAVLKSMIAVLILALTWRWVRRFRGQTAPAPESD